MQRARLRRPHPRLLPSARKSAETVADDVKVSASKVGSEASGAAADIVGSVSDATEDVVTRIKQAGADVAGTVSASTARIVDETSEQYRRNPVVVIAIGVVAVAGLVAILRAISKR